METLKYQTETKAKKEHRCNFCNEKIAKREIYIKSTHKYDGEVYDWKVHLHCAKIAEQLKMYDNADEGVTEEIFQETIHSVHDDLLINQLSGKELKKYSDVIQQLRKVGFKDKLGYVIRYHNKLDKEEK